MPIIERLTKSFGWVLVLLLLAACQAGDSTSGSIPETGEDPWSLQVSDQVFAKMIVVDVVIADDPAWLVIRADRSGRPAEIVGYTYLEPGEHQTVAVEIDPVAATERLHAMLYADAGLSGEFEIGDPDVPVEIDGQSVAQAFTLRVDPTALAGEDFQDEVEVRLISDRFEPARINLRAGATVKWINQDDEPHTVTAEDLAFRSETLEPGDEFEFTFTRPGRYPYYCEFKGGPGGRGMAGVIIVLD